SEAMTVFAEYARVTPPSFQLIVGSAVTFYVGLCLGAKAGILALANVAPQECVQIHRLFIDGKHEEAKECQLQLLSMAHAVGPRFGIAGVKVAMDLRGYYGGPRRRPLLPLKAEDVEALRDELVAANMIS
ncbi:MAG: dihydrodipicolinate synthase family protein, partial [Candidatus Methylomirabilaceae bacterium]